MKEKVFTKISYTLYRKLVNYKEAKKFSTLTRAIRFIIFTTDVEPVEDYDFVTKTAKMIMITIESPNLEQLEELSEKHGKMKSRLIRELLNGYFFRIKVFENPAGFLEEV